MVTAFILNVCQTNCIVIAQYLQPNLVHKTALRAIVHALLEEDRK